MKLARITLLIPDYDAAIGFFTEVLGFRLLEDTRLGATKRWVRVGSADGGGELLLACPTDPVQRALIGRQGGGRVWLFAETDDIVRDHGAMLAKGVMFEEAPRIESYGAVAVFKDPWGNRWDLIEPAAPR